MKTISFKAFIKEYKPEKPENNASSYAEFGIKLLKLDDENFLMFGQGRTFDSASKHRKDEVWTVFEDEIFGYSLKNGDHIEDWNAIGYLMATRPFYRSENVFVGKPQVTQVTKPKRTNPTPPYSKEELEEITLEYARMVSFGEIGKIFPDMTVRVGSYAFYMSKVELYNPKSAWCLSSSEEKNCARIVFKSISELNAFARSIKKESSSHYRHYKITHWRAYLTWEALKEAQLQHQQKEKELQIERISK